ncbi:MAG TPA: histidinol-phosphate transaminase [Victivallales bacterium]|nr:histidinol-phosphate transaminase [Victivallales bacterium]
MKSFFRKNIDAMDGYTPGEQPKRNNLIKLNTNENPYPPSPKVAQILKEISCESLRFYPNPTSDPLRHKLSEIFDLKIENIITGNGSDDILTIILRSFVNENENIVCFDPTYSLYPVLAQIENSNTVTISLTENYKISDNFFDRDFSKICSDIHNKVFFISRPNSPTGNSFCIDKIRKICSVFKGIVVVDEAYVDFAEDTCIKLINEFKNVIITRTLSKSYSLAGIRLGWAMADQVLISGMMKVKDSYNVNQITQKLALAAVTDQQYLKTNIIKVITTRKYLTEKLTELGFTTINSQANFIFTSPPEKNAEDLFKYLRKNNVITRYFPSKKTGEYLRISVGTDKEIQLLIELCKSFLSLR